MMAVVMMGVRVGDRVRVAGTDAVGVVVEVRR